MKKPINELSHDVLNSTGGIYWVLKPYWKNKLLEDQHFAYVCACLRRIENACKKYNEEQSHES